MSVGLTTEAREKLRKAKIDLSVKHGRLLSMSDVVIELTDKLTETLTSRPAAEA